MQACIYQDQEQGSHLFLMGSQEPPNDWDLQSLWTATSECVEKLPAIAVLEELSPWAGNADIGLAIPE